ncbi:MAG: VanZ family protein [Fibrobacteria bacterium]
MSILFYTSSLPGNRIHLPPFAYSDKAVHFAAYAALGALIAWRKWLRGKSAAQDLYPNAAGELRKRRESRDLRELRDLPDGRGLAVGMLYGVSDEIHQIFVPERMFDYSDMAADFLGVVAGVWAFRKLAEYR